MLERYGPWALVAGASDGVGAEFARELATRGLDVVLLARRRDVLEEVAARIRAETGREARTLSVDLAEPGAAQTVVDATADLDVGLVVYCAGADPNYQPFLANPVETATSMVHRNCIVPLQLAHHYAQGMVDRGRGGIIVLSSGAMLVGARNMVAYAASKAFDTVMAEALWAELHDRGVDVLGLVLGATDTPALRRLLVDRGQLPHVDAPLTGVASPAQVVEEALDALGREPTWFVGEELREGAKALGGMARGDAVRVMLEMGAGLMGAD